MVISINMNIKRSFKDRAMNDISDEITMADMALSECNNKMINNIQKASILIEKNKDLKQRFRREFDVFESDLDFIKNDFIKNCICTNK